MTNYPIEHNHPLPDPILHGSKSRYPLRLMEIGDSFYTDEPNIKKLRCIIANGSHRLGKHFITRRESGGHRIWRDK